VESLFLAHDKTVLNGKLDELTHSSQIAKRLNKLRFKIHHGRTGTLVQRGRSRYSETRKVLPREMLGPDSRRHRKLGY
jgi:hypothetical protein